MGKKLKVEELNRYAEKLQRPTAKAVASRRSKANLLSIHFIVLKGSGI
jgi:hypothetical protein